MLSNDDFKKVIELTPLIAIDLIIKFENKFLLGKRINEPAKDYYFVPGGRILKDEKINDAFNRLSKDELGININLEKLKFHKVAEHHYKKNYFNDDSSTHYICLSYKYELNINEFNLLNLTKQHNDVLWLSKNDLLENYLVHQYTKNYFI
tara:strand:- start:488 stop:937 length:450 start_codon:yes stop_codon:yes gene_type:complete